MCKAADAVAARLSAAHDLREACQERYGLCQALKTAFRPANDVPDDIGLLVTMVGLALERNVS